jgi:cyclophilin family peptidyl-prolyl cis-trans isomerase/HEAT repeat protein
MMRGLACAALVAALVAVGAGQRPAGLMSLAEAEQAILVIEDRRLELPPDLRAPALDALRERQAFDLELLLDLSRFQNRGIQRLAIRALGRYERRELTTDLLTLLQTGPGREVAFALAQSLRGPALPQDDSGQQVRGIMEALLARGTNLRRDDFASSDPSRTPLASDDALPAVLRALGRLPYARPEQVQTADVFFVKMFALLDPDPDGRGLMNHVADGSETLTRLHRKLSPPGQETIGWLRRIVESRRRTYPALVRVAAMRALVTAGAVDTDTLRIAAQEPNLDELRRLAAIALGGGGSTLVDTERTSIVLDLLLDRSQQVRIEAVRAYARNETAAYGCPRLLEVLREDRSHHVRAVTVGLLAGACPGDPDVTNALVGLLTVPSPARWHDAAHAMVALARRAPMRLESPLRTTFVKYPEWQVRMYAARAASMMDDLPVLERLGYDAHHNVREAALAALKRLKGQEAEPFFLEALKQTDYQLLRTAARELAGLQPTPALAAALASALTRATQDRSETSRDVRLALLERLAAFGDDNHVGALVPLLRDFDIQIAQRTAAVLAQWTGGAYEIDPQLMSRPVVGAPSATILEVNTSSGPPFEITLLPSVAPITSGRFLQLATSGYYDGLTFHRVVPNFVIQGGSPGANEYAGHQLYTRDERSDRSHTRGTVGLSTRGRDTGDMQFFINLVDNPRLDYEYTVFGQVAEEHMPIVERILEGDMIRTIRIKKSDEKK